MARGGYGETAQDEGGAEVSEWEDERDAGSLGMGGVAESEQLGDRRTGCTKNGCGEMDTLWDIQ